MGEDYVFLKLERKERYPVREYRFGAPIDPKRDRCPNWLCDKTYERQRMVLYYDTGKENTTTSFRDEYLDFSRTLLDVVIESTFGYGKMKFYALSCCANEKFCT